MNKYKIIDIKRNVVDAAFGCGPMESLIVSTITYKDDVVHYLTLVDLVGCPTIYLSDKDLHDIFACGKPSKIMDNKDLLNKYVVKEIEGTEIETYKDFYLKWVNNQNDPFLMLIDYLIGVNKVIEEDLNDLIEYSKNEFIEDLDVLDNEIKDEILNNK